MLPQFSSVAPGIEITFNLVKTASIIKETKESMPTHKGAFQVCKAKAQGPGFIVETKGELHCSAC